ncbi:MAG TPA: aminotransferase class IV, partial [Isosphaeraceae bacterium]|nr:aminotransferase class IV [Isosphaeraceae bacterium]
MIWTRDGIVVDQALSVSVLDRTFEHGLGLFETMRTWNGRAPLLRRHLQRLQNSAQELDLPLDPASLPDQEAIQALLKASRIEGDARLRLVASGGTPDGQPCIVFLRAWPVDRWEWTNLRIGYAQWQFNPPLERHKTLNYWGKNHLWHHI